MKILEHRFEYGLTIGILLVCTLGAIGSLQFRAVSTWFPLFVGVTGALLAIVVLAVDIANDRRARHHVPTPATIDPLDVIELETGIIATREIDEAEQRPSTVVRAFVRYIAWFAGFAALFLLVGLPLSVLVWIFLFVRFAAKESWLRAVLSALIMTALLFVLAATLNLGLPEGILLDSSAIIPSWRL